jgi:hypothetical protein
MSGIAWMAILFWVGFLGEGEARTIWSSKPVDSGRIIRESFPVGNGQLGGKCPWN